MWIIPKNLNIYHSAQAMEALTLDLSELSEMSEQSLMWRSKPFQSATWLRRWKMDLLTQHLYGRILKPSLGNSLIKKWISSVEASLVSHSVPQEEEKEMKTQDTCGPTSKKGFNSLENLPLFSWKMLKESSAQSSEAINGPTPKAHLFCFMYSESWKDWVTKQRRAYSQRVKSVHHINENESLYLVSEMNSQKKALIGSTDLLATQKNQEQHGRLLEVKSSIGMNHQELRWTTPTTGMEMREIGAKLEHFQRRLKLKKQIGLQGAITLDNQGFIGNLNPRWVEMLMGVPIGWTMPSCTNPVTIEQMNLECLEMESCPTQLQGHLKQCGKNWGTPTTLDSREHSMKKTYKPRKTGKSRKGEGVARQVLEGFNEMLYYNIQGAYLKDGPYFFDDFEP